MKCLSCSACRRSGMLRLVHVCTRWWDIQVQCAVLPWRAPRLWVVPGTLRCEYGRFILASAFMFWQATWQQFAGMSWCRDSFFYVQVFIILPFLFILLSYGSLVIVGCCVLFLSCSNSVVMDLHHPSALSLFVFVHSSVIACVVFALLSFFSFCSVQFDGKYVVSGSYDCTVRVWFADSGECFHVLQGHNNRVYSLQVGT